jgi:hypothetical protein
LIDRARVCVAYFSSGPGASCNDMVAGLPSSFVAFFAG